MQRVRRGRRRQRRVPGGKILLAALLMGLLAAAFWLPRILDHTPERALCSMLDALQDGKPEKAERYTTGPLGFTDARRARRLQKALLGTLRYAVGQSHTEGDNAVIIVSVTIADLEALLADASQELLDHSLGGGAWDARYDRLLADRIHAGEAADSTYTVTAVMVRRDGRWYLDPARSGELLEAVSGGIGPF